MTEISGAAEPSPHPPARGIDWGKAAEWLADGLPVDLVARALGVHRGTVWRQLGNSRLLRERLRDLRQRRREQAAARIEALRGSVARTLERALADDDRRVATWLAKELKIAQGDAYDRAPQTGVLEPRADVLFGKDLSEVSDTLVELPEEPVDPLDRRVRPKGR